MAKKLRSAAESVAGKFIETTEQKPAMEKLEALGQQRLIEKDEKPEPKPKKKAQAPKEKKQETAPPEPPKQPDDPTEAKKAIGQPKKYDEPTKHVSFSLPLSVIEDLKILAGLKKTNQTQLILSMIKNELKAEQDRIAIYKELLE
jgi:hypothetical protein